jgi:GNAT superfamily N-acetyltransferase
MFEHIKMVIGIIYEAVKEGKLLDIFHDQVWNHRIATPAVMDLTQLPPPGDLFEGTDLRFLEMKLDVLKESNWVFTTPSRRSKALRNLKRGWRGFAVLQDSKVIGDMWCVTPQAGQTVTHPDLKMLGIECEAKDVYAWDMLIDPAYRGKNLAVPIQRSLWNVMKAEGFERLYGYYWDSNIPALWMHRMLKFKELPKRWASRFFFIKWAGGVKSAKKPSVENASGT